MVKTYLCKQLYRETSRNNNIFLTNNNHTKYKTYNESI